MKKITEMFDVELLFKSFCFWIFLYSVFIAFLEVSLYYILIPLLIHFLTLYFSLRPHNEEIIATVFGENPRTKFRDGIEFDQSSTSVLNTAFSIAQEAALRDYDSNDSIEAIKMCSENGCKFINLDVHITIDNVALIRKKSTLFSNNDEHSISKSIEECNFEELCSKSRDELEEHRLCPLEEILSTIEDADMKVMFNIIHSPYYRSSDSVVLTMLNIYRNNPFLYRKAVICSTNPFILYKIRALDSSVVVSLKWERFSDKSSTTISWLKNFRYSCTIQHFMLEIVDFCLWWLLNSFIYRIVGISAVILPKEIVTPYIVEDWERKNVRCIVAAVNLSTEKFYYANALGVAFLTDTLIID